MKVKFQFYLTLLIPVFVFTACSDSDSKSNTRQIIDTPEKLTSTIFNALQTNDQAGFEKLVVTRKDYIQVFQDYLNRSSSRNNSGSMRKKFIRLRLKTLRSISDKDFYKRTHRIRNSLAKIIDAAKKVGVNIKDSKFVKIAGVRVRQHSGSAKYDIYFFVSYKNVEYEIKIDDAVVTATGIKLFDDMQWRGKVPPGSKGTSNTRAIKFLKSL